MWRKTNRRSAPVGSACRSLHEANEMTTELAEDQFTAIKASQKMSPIKNIIVALDLSPHSKATPQYASGIAKTFGASLVLIHVYEPLQTNEFLSEEDIKRLDHEQDVVRQALTDLTKTLQKTFRLAQRNLLLATPPKKSRRRPVNSTPT
jgi:hypothetical protein